MTRRSEATKSFIVGYVELRQHNLFIICAKTLKSKFSGVCWSLPKLAQGTRELLDKHTGIYLLSLCLDVVQVVCSHNAITARIQKEVIETASYTMENVHLNDKECAFDTEEGDFYVRTISPLTSCGTHFEVCLLMQLKSAIAT